MRDLRFFAPREGERVIFKNSDAATWGSGNFTWSNGIGHFYNYNNRIHIVELPNSSGVVTITHVVNSGFSMNVYFSEEGVNFYDVGITNTGGTIVNTSYKYAAILLWDKPSASQAQAEDITVTYKYDGTPIFSSIYSLSGYTTDGTANTAINTGLTLCNGNYDSWSLQALVSFDTKVSTMASYLRCRDAASPYPGFSVRSNNAQSNRKQLQVNDASSIAEGVIADMPYSVNINFLKGVGGTIFFNSVLAYKYASISTSSPFTIGGELDSNLNWIANRFGRETIYSLTIFTKI